MKILKIVLGVIAVLIVTTLIVAGAVALTLGISKAHADPVAFKPGVSCDDVWGVINCTNDTDTDVEVTQTKQCAEGSWMTTDYEMVYNYGTHSSTSVPKSVFHHTDSQTKVATVFVAAHNTALGLNGCDHDTAAISYATR